MRILIAEDDAGIGRAVQVLLEGKDLGRRAAQCAAPTRKAAKRYL